MLRMCLLEVATPDLAAGNVGRDREDRDSAPMRIVESIDQMEIPGPAASRTHRQTSRQVRLSSGSKCRRLFVSHGNPPDIGSLTNAIGDAIEGVAGHSIDSLDPSKDQRVD
jgi:hypothetical protein